MTLVAPPGSAEPAAPRTGAQVFLSGVRRGSVLAFVPLALAGQAIAWIEYAISGWYRPWSWVKIGFAYTLTGARVGFDATVRAAATRHPSKDLPFSEQRMEIAVGALVVLAVVLLFRAGQEQGKLRYRSPAAAAAGASVALGFAVPCLLIAFPVRLVFPQLGIASLRPVLWQAFVLPAALGLVCGVAGGLSAAGGGPDHRAWPATVTAAARGAWAAFTWGLMLAFLGFLVLAGVEPRTTGGYARAARDGGSAGAVLVVHHALLLPNQSGLILTTAMGGHIELSLSDHPVAELTLDGVLPLGRASDLFPDGVQFGPWYGLFLLVPGVAALLGGRRAGRSSSGLRQAVLRGALGGVGFAVLAGVGAWASSITLPFAPGLLRPPVVLEAGMWRTAMLALPWGVVGGVLGALVPERGPAPERPPSAQLDVRPPNPYLTARQEPAGPEAPAPEEPPSDTSA